MSDQVLVPSGLVALPFDATMTQSAFVPTIAPASSAHVAAQNSFFVTPDAVAVALVSRSLDPRRLGCAGPVWGGTSRPRRD